VCPDSKHGGGAVKRNRQCESQQMKSVAKKEAREKARSGKRREKRRDLRQTPDKSGEGLFWVKKVWSRSKAIRGFKMGNVRSSPGNHRTVLLEKD